jgi:acetoin utilization deacetylase AcuC-like enzyme
VLQLLQAADAFCSNTALPSDAVFIAQLPVFSRLHPAGFCYVNDIVLAILELLKYHQRYAL